MTNKSVLIDCDNKECIPGFHSTNFSFILSGKAFSFISQSERNQLLYKQIKENCDIDFLMSEELAHIEFYPVPVVYFFACDSKGNYFGTLEGFGDLENKDFPVVYINKNNLSYGKIADNLKEFFSIVNYYPNWRAIIESEEQSISKTLVIQNNEMLEDEGYLEVQKQIGDALKLIYDPNALELFANRLHANPGFTVYESKHVAATSNKIVTFEEFLGIEIY